MDQRDDLRFMTDYKCFKSHDNLPPHFRTQTCTSIIKICFIKVEKYSKCYLLWNLYLYSSAETMSSRRMYLDLGSSPDTRNFIWGNICLEIKTFEEVNMDEFFKVLPSRFGNDHFCANIVELFPKLTRFQINFWIIINLIITILLKFQL